MFGPVGGLFADRNSKRKILIFTQTFSLLVAIVLGLSVTLKFVSFFVVIILAVSLGLINVFDNPARQSFVVELVGTNDLSNAIGLNTVLINLARIVGPATGGVLIGFVGIAWCFYLNAVSFFAVIIALVLMRRKDLYSKPPIKAAKNQIRDGFKYVAHKKDLLVPLLVITVVGTLAYNFQVTLLLLARQSFHLSSSASGMFFAFMGIGAVIGGLIVAGRKQPSNRAFIVSTLCFGVLITLVALSPNVIFGEVLVIPMGTFSIFFIAYGNTILQLRSDPSFRGRVMAFYAIAFLGTTPIGSLIVSAVASTFNPRVAIGLGGVATFITGVVAGLYYKKMRDI